MVGIWLSVLGAAADAPASHRASVGCGSAPPVSPGASIVTRLRVGDLDREYRLHVPKGYDGATAVPLVVAIHGYTGTAEALETKDASFSRHADAHGYAVAYPQATGFEVDGRLITSWNDLGCNASPGPEGPICTEDADDYPTPPECGEPRQCDWCSCHDDVGFIAALLDELERALCVDLDRVYVTGISNGAMLAHRLGCDLPGRFAAIAPVAGTIARGFACAPGTGQPISMMNISGSRDRVVPFDGSPASDGFLYTPTSQVLAAWAGNGSQRCDADNSPYPTSRDGVAGFGCVQRANCATGAEVVDCAWDGGHDFPYKGSDQFAIDVMWEFFERNGR
jgi:polyhydroxybutyrate depolymerase